MASFDDVVKAGDAVAAIIAAGIIPAGLEMMDRKATAAVEPFVHAGYDLTAAAILLAESDGAAEEVADEVAAIERVLRDAGATAIRVSRSEAERLRYWSGRKNAFPAAGRISPDYYCMDGTIPRRWLGRMLKTIEQLEDKHQLQVHECIPCRRRQPPSAHFVRCQPAGELERAETNSGPISSSCACRWAARLPASMAWEWRSSIRCACSSPRPSAPRSSRSSACLIRPAYSIPARPFRLWRVAPSMAGCMCIAASCRILSCRDFRCTPH